MAVAFVDRGVSAPQIVMLAAEGRLPSASRRGELLRPFQANIRYVRKLGALLRRKRAGRTDGRIAEAAPRDAIEELRRRLVSAAEEELAEWEKLKKGTRDLDRLRQIMRATREAAALPGPKDARPPKPGDKTPGGGDASRVGGPTTGGLAGQILKAAGMSAGTTERPVGGAQNGSAD